MGCQAASYHFDIIYKLGLENRGADALSQMYEEEELNDMAHHPIWPEGKAVIEEVHHNDVLRNIIEALQQNKDTKPDYFFIGRGCFFIKGGWSFQLNSRGFLHCSRNITPLLRVAILGSITAIRDSQQVYFGWA